MMSRAGGALTARAGVTLPELMLVSWLFALVLLGLARFAAAQGRLTAATQDRVRVAETFRTTTLVLDGELRYAAPPDLVLAPDSVRLRAVRGGGVICATEGSSVLLRYRGVRRPDPTKDSALVITAPGTEGATFRVAAVSADNGCGGPGYRLRLEPDPPPMGVVQVYEPGSYHLTGGAFRYRRGAAGRQPVTEAILTVSRFESRPRGVEVRLALHPDSVPRVPNRTATAIIRFLNGEVP